MIVQFLLPCFNSIRDDSIGLNLLGLQWKTRFWNFQTEIMFSQRRGEMAKNLPDLLGLKTSQDLTFLRFHENYVFHKISGNCE